MRIRFIDGRSPGGVRSFFTQGLSISNSFAYIQIMIKKHIIIILLQLIILLVSCGASRKITIPIEMKNKTLSFYSLRGIDKLKSSALCDSCKNIKLYNKMVIKETDLLYKNILSELRRCAKFGIYKVTDSISPHDISITIELYETIIQNDTLIVPVKQTTIELSTKQKEVEEYLIKSEIPSYDGKDEKSLLYSAGRTLLSFRKNFPYENIIKRYYQSE